jgi:microsomal dipeptidase-like Zn-dependent dipeptidase
MSDPRIIELHEQAPLTDLHCHPPLKLYLLEDKKFHEGHDASESEGFLSMCTDAPSFVQGHVKVALATTHVPEKPLVDDCGIIRVVSGIVRRAKELFEGQPDEMTRRMLSYFEDAVVQAQAKNFPVVLCRSFQEVLQARQAGKIAFVHAIEGGHSLLGNRSVEENLKDYYDRGVCLLTLAHFYDHGISPPVPGVPDDDFLSTNGCFRKALRVDQSLGLHPAGRKAVQLMLEMGMIVDLTHSTQKAREEVYQIWKTMPPRYQRPLVFTHAGLHAMAPRHAMNPGWDELRFIQSTGGAIGIIFMNYWLMGNTLHGSKDSMRYVVQALEMLRDQDLLACTAIGSDFDGFTNPPKDLKEPSDFPNLTDELLTRRRFPGRIFRPEEVKALLGGNAMRAIELGWTRAPATSPAAAVGPSSAKKPAPAAAALLDALHCWKEPAPAAMRTGAAEPDLLSPDGFKALRDLLEKNPGLWKDHPPPFFKEEPTFPQIERVLREVSEFLASGPQVEAALSALMAAPKHVDLPKGCRFEGYAGSEVPIDPSRKDKKTSDVLKWFTTWAASVKYRHKHPKPPLPNHGASSTRFHYPLVRQNGAASVALFSDWGTDYYHSEYILRHIANLSPAQAIHLGDVYYAGSPSEMERFMRIPMNNHLLSRTPTFVMNANHEMMHHSIPLLEFIAWKRGQYPEVQKQEGTYFCLYDDTYQIVAIDTDYHKGGRYEDPALKQWLEETLRSGRQNRKINILLSQHEAYKRGGMSTLLKEDLKDLILRDQLVDLWFWGDEHFCALYGPSERTAFVGSCIGHGGYAFEQQTPQDMTPPEDVARYVWGETARRLPTSMPGAKDAVGNNGFCLLDLSPDHISLKYLDWRKQLRYHTRLSVVDGWLRLSEKPVYEGPAETHCSGEA